MKTRTPSFDRTLQHAVVCASLLVVCLDAGPLSASPLSLEKASSHNPVPGMAVYEDAGGRQTLETIERLPAELFTRQDREMLNFSHHGSTYWGRFQVTTTQADLRLLEIDNPQIDSVTVFVVHGQARASQTSGDLRPFRDRPLEHRNFVFPITFEPGSTDVYVRVQSRGSLFIGMTLFAPAAFAKADYNAQFGFGLYYGIFIVMLFFNLLIFLAVRDVSYILYVVYIAAFGVFQFALNGFGYQFLWSNSPGVANHILPLLGGSAIFWALVFTRTFLQLSVHTPALNRFVQILTAVTALGVISSGFTDYTTSIQIVVVISVAFSVCAPACAIAVLVKGFRPAFYFLLAWSFFFVGIVVFGLFITGLVPASFFTKYALQAGAATELVVLSFALGDRLNALRMEKEAAQAMALEEQKQKAALMAGMNVRLEDEVQRKTADLNQAVEQLKLRESRVQIELKLAHDIQRGLLPPENIELQNFKVVTYHRFLTQVGGDFADVIPMRGGRLGVLIADVSGHGIPAALVTTMAKLSFAEHSQTHHLPSRILRSVNNQLVPAISSLAHLTAFIMVIDRQNHVIYSGAAHQEPMVFRKSSGQVDFWTGQGFIVGCMPDTGKFYFDTRDRLRKGDRCLLYTDGMVDCRNGPDEIGTEFGFDRLKEVFERSCRQPIEEARALIADEFEKYVEHNADDDASFLILEVTGD